MPPGLKVNLEIAPSDVSAKVKRLDRVLTPAESALRRRIRNQFLLRDSRIVSSDIQSSNQESTARIQPRNNASQKCYRVLTEKKQIETCLMLVSRTATKPAIIGRDQTGSPLCCSYILGKHTCDLRRFLGRRFALCFVGSEERLLHRATRFAFVPSTWSL